MFTREKLLTAVLCLSLGRAVCFGHSPADVYYQAIRDGNSRDLQRLVKTADVNGKDDKGASPLMYAAAYGTIDSMRLLLNSGADPNAQNAFGETALMWCAGDEAKVRLLLEHGADVKARSKQGRTALYIAAAKDGNSEVVRLLLDKGADPVERDARQSTPLAAATFANDLATVQLLLKKGADANTRDAVGWTPLMNAAANGNTTMIRLLLKHGADVNAVTAKETGPGVKHGAIQIGFETPLLLAAPGAGAEAVRVLLAAGAKVDVQDVRGLNPLALAIATDHANPEVVRLLLQHGASLKQKDANGEDAVAWARKFNDPAILDVLGMKASPVVDVDFTAIPGMRKPMQAAELGTAMLQGTGTTFFQESGCSSCHAQNMTALPANVVRAKGTRVDEAAAAGALKGTQAMWAYFAPTLLERMDPPGGAEMAAYALMEFDANAVQPNRTTDDMVHYLLASQRTAGNWRLAGLARPPMEDGDFSRTALSIPALLRYAPAARRAEVDRAIVSAAHWLSSAQPVTSEDRAMQLLGLKWAGLDKPRQEFLTGQLAVLQRPNGGWGQTANLAADAYATGQVLFALHEAGIAGDSAVYRKGANYLLGTQLKDGSWHVASRAAAIQPYFESGFPHGRDQWISSAATAWASLALVYAEPVRAMR